MIHTNGMELLRAMLKRTYVGVYSHMGATHPWRTSNGFAGRRNVGPVGTEFQRAHWCKFYWQAAPSL